MEIYSHPDIPEILSLPGNSYCCDCNSEKPKWSSLNNGIFLCLKCAGMHRSLGVDISTVRSLQIDSWTDKQIYFLSKGGNNKFKQNLSEFNIDPNTQIDSKYKSKAADYYRKILKNEVEKSTNKDYKEIEIIKPSLEEGKELIDIKKGQEEVNNSKVIGQYNEQKKEEEGFLSAFGSFLNSVKQTAGDVAGKITKEFDELKIGDKLKDAGDTVVGYAKESGSYIKDKTQQVLNNEYVQGITKTAESGINLVIEKTKNLLNNDNNNQQQNINPDLLNKNENDENNNIQMSEIINDGNNINNDNNINVINNINNDNIIENKKENQKNEEIPKKEEEEKKKDESNSTGDSKNVADKEENKNESENSEKK